MIARVDAAVYGVLLLLRVQIIANPGKTRNSHLIELAIKTNPTVFPLLDLLLVYIYKVSSMYNC